MFNHKDITFSTICTYRMQESSRQRRKKVVSWQTKFIWNVLSTINVNNTSDGNKNNCYSYWRIFNNTKDLKGKGHFLKKKALHTVYQATGYLKYWILTWRIFIIIWYLHSSTNTLFPKMQSMEHQQTLIMLKRHLS